MNSSDIKRQIDLNFEKIEQYVEENIGTFVYDERIDILQKEIVKLKNMCEHDFVGGQCIYCYTEEEYED